MPSPDEFALRTWTELAGERSRATTTSDLAKEIARREKIANDQRIRLFWVIVGIVCLSILAVAAFILLLGTFNLTIEVPIAVAFISAMAVQSFVLIGLLVRGLFMAPKHSASEEVE